MPSFNEKFGLLQKHVIGMLGKLPPHFTYHHAGHTLDVLAQATLIAKAEGITDEWDLWLLRSAALLHDTGFLHVYRGHEERSCAVAEELLPAYGYTPGEITYVQSLIMATRIPQTPADQLAKILCDADLDYLGRDDYWEIAENLRKEWMHEGVIATQQEWISRQVSFLESHNYFTQYALTVRTPVKMGYLEKLRQSGI
ncbi:MAG: HD domain-containing protein [Chitinophagaceae bacterium]|jgi:predicted metal-dependent HD superfamily phosphohydrolase|nr:HD domain-containing protein [Chitinophagaceae bacterium]